MNSKDKALLFASVASSKRGQDVRILDLRPIPGFTDFFVLATGTSDRHVRSLSDAVLEAARHTGERPLGVEDGGTARWVLVDLGDVVVHCFQRDAREFYSLERLWGDAEDVELPLAAEA